MNKLILVLLGVLACSLVSAKKCPQKVYQCTAASRVGDFCPEIYAPVCGYRPDIVCITTPCNLVTYANSCEACHDETVKSYTVGKCTKLD